MLKSKRNACRDDLAIFILAAILALVAGIGAASINRLYSKSWDISRFGDASFYTYATMALGERAKEFGRLDALSSEVRENNRSPLFTIPLLLVAPGELRSLNAHIYTSGFAMFLFLASFGWTIRRRTGSLAYAAAAEIAALGMERFFDPRFGIPLFMFDLTAAMFIGAATFALLNSNSMRRRRWTIFAAVLVSLACFSRSISVFYASLTLVPMMLSFLAIRCRGGSSRANILADTFIPLLIASSLCLPFLLNGYAQNQHVYEKFGYGCWAVSVGQSIGGSIDYLSSYLGTNFLYLGALLLCTHLALIFFARHRRLSLFHLIASSWIPLSPLLLTNVLLRTSPGHFSIDTYVLPGLLLLFFSPFPLLSFRTPRTPIFSLAGSLLFVISIAIASSNYAWVVSTEKNISIDQAELKRFQSLLSAQLARGGRKIVWAPFFWEYHASPSVGAMQNHGVLPLSNPIFTIHQTYWEARYPSMSVEEIQGKVYEEMVESIEIAVVCNNFSTRTKYPDANWCETSEKISRYIANSIRSDPRWKKDFELYGPFGPVVGYQNLRVRPNLYRWRLQNLLAPAPESEIP